jgi:septum site-determining protein MinC
MPSISFKGTRDGLCITLGEGSWRDLLDELAQQLDRPGAQSFFRGARVLLETGTRALGVVEIEELISLLAKHQMTLGSVVGENQTPGNGQSNGTSKLLPNESIPPPESFSASDGHDITDQPDAANEPPALLLRRTVRSGQVITHPGTIFIIGDINPGAEVVAGGDVIVWGRLRGVVHAGASGNENAIVGALSLTPTQLRIGGQIARAPDDRRPRTAPAEIAHVRDGQIVVEPWGSLSG